MNRKWVALFLTAMFTALVLTGCGASRNPQVQPNGGNAQNSTAADELLEVTLSSEIKQIDENFMAVQYDKDYGFDDFLNQGGASSDAEVIEFLTSNLLSGSGLGYLGDFFGCSTIVAKDASGDTLFGRNFDWEKCEAMVVVSKPKNDYQSISTVNMDFIEQGRGGTLDIALKLDDVRTIAALYAPLDGMNERGFAVSVNMIQDPSNIDQTTDKPDITTTTAIRLLLNKAANVEEALRLLKQYDMHASMGMMVHFALTDNTGRSVVVEYINDEMVVTDTPVVTNFYLAQGKKYGIGTVQSHERYDILMGRHSQSNTMNMVDMRDALDSVSKDNFDEFASTEWSIVFNLSTREALYYHRENYQKGYQFTLS